MIMCTVRGSSFCIPSNEQLAFVVELVTIQYTLTEQTRVLVSEYKLAVVPYHIITNICQSET